MKRDLDFSADTRRYHYPYDACQIVEYPCFTALPRDDETPLEFRIDKTNAFIDLNRTFLEIEIQLLNKDGTELRTELDDQGKVKKAYRVAPINNVGCALFENVELHIYDHLVTTKEHMYPWWTYVQQLLYTDENQRKYQMASDVHWSEDTAATFDSTGTDNAGFEARYAVFNDSSKVTLYVPLILNKQFDRLIPPQIEVMIKYYRAPTSMTLMGEAGKSYKIKVWNAKLMVGRVKMGETFYRHYERVFMTKGFTYPTNSIQTTVRAVSKGDQNVDWLPFTGRLPRKLYLWQVSHEAYNGQIDKNILNFQSFRINRLQITKNGVSVPTSLGFSDIQDNDYSLLYKLSKEAINSRHCTIKRSEYNFGYLIIVVDLTADEQIDETKQGTLRVTLDYSNPLPGAITLFCMGEFTETIHINGKQKLVTIKDGT